MSDTPFTFGDAEPEDAWDDGDPLGVRLDVLTRIAAALADNPDDDRFDGRLLNALRLAHKLAAEVAEYDVRVDGLLGQLEGLD